MRLLGVWFTEAPSNITVRAELAEISHQSTSTAGTTTCKCTHICGIRTEFNEKEVKTVQNHFFFDILHFVSVFEALSTNGFDIIARIFRVLPPLFFTNVKCRKVESILTGFDHLSHLVLLSSQKERWKTGKF